MKSIIVLAQRARVSCKHITREVFLDSILPIAVILIALLLTIGLAIPVIDDVAHTPAAGQSQTVDNTAVSANTLTVGE